MRKNQHIAILCNYRLLPNRVGGMDHFFWRFDAECKANGIEVDWFFPNKENHGKYSELRIIPAEGNTLESTFLSYFQHKKTQYSHIITHFLELCTPFFKKAKNKTDAKIIAVDHNPRPVGGYSLKKRLKKQLKGVVFSQYIDVFVGVSEYTKQELIRDFGSQIRLKSKVIYNGILTENIPQRTSEHQPPRFVVVSHLRASKGIQDLIEAVALLSEAIKEKIVIDIYGEGPYEAILKELVRFRKVAQNFDFKGSSSAISKVYSQYDYLLHPTHMECFSLTILESLAANVPVITTPVGGNPEIIKDGINGFIIPMEAPEKLSKIIEKLWKGEETIQKNTRSGIVERFALDRMVEEHFKLINPNS